jgi:hypothetical protein
MVGAVNPRNSNQTAPLLPQGGAETKEDMMSKPKALPANYPIQPRHIDTKKRFFDAFGNCETEISANWIVRMCQERGHWGDFGISEINALYHEKYPGHPFGFNRLIPHHNPDSGPIVKMANGKYRITHKFVAVCFRASPRQ